MADIVLNGTPFSDDCWKKNAPSCSSDGCLPNIQSYYRTVLSYGKDSSRIVMCAQADPWCLIANSLTVAYALSCRRGRTQQDTTHHIKRIKSILSNRGAGCSRYEYLLAHSVVAWFDADWTQTIDLHLQLARDFPLDLLSVKRCQTLCFYLGRQDVMLQLAKQVLPWNISRPYMHGLLAFALLENGLEQEAEAEAMAGLKILPSDIWCQHALCHSLQHQGGYLKAVETISQWSHMWNHCASFLYSHMWWHIATCHLQIGGQLDVVLRIYDKHLWGGTGGSSALVHLDAMSLLLQLDIRGHSAEVDRRVQMLVLQVHSQMSWRHDNFLLLLSLWAFERTSSMVANVDPSPRADLAAMVAILESRLLQLSDTCRSKMMPHLSVAVVALQALGRGIYPRSVMGSKEWVTFRSISLKGIGASDQQLTMLDELVLLCVKRANLNSDVGHCR